MARATILDALTPRSRANVSGHVSNLALSASGYIATLRDSRVVMSRDVIARAQPTIAGVHDTTTGEILARVSSPRPIRRVAVSCDQRLLLVVHRDR